MYRKNKSILFFPPIKNKEKTDNFNQTQNKFHFFLRFEKPLKIVEPTRNYFDNSLLLTKLQKRKLKEMKKYSEQFKKQNQKYYNNISSSLYEYKNMIPIKIWKKCEKTYNECRQEFNLLSFNKDKKKLSVNNKRSMNNLKIRRNNKIYFENQGLSKFIENIEKSFINNSYL